jgi:hypothetical protein
MGSSVLLFGAGPTGLVCGFRSGSCDITGTDYV